MCEPLAMSTKVNFPDLMEERKRGLSPTLSENAIGCDMEFAYI